MLNKMMWAVIGVMLYASFGFAADVIELRVGSVAVISAERLAGSGLDPAGIQAVVPKTRDGTQSVVEMTRNQTNDMVLKGLSAGSVDIMLSDTSGNQRIYTIVVSSATIEQARHLLKDLPSVEIDSVDGIVSASGRVSFPEDLERVEIVCTRLGIINLVTLDTISMHQDLGRRLEEIIGIEGVTVSVVAGKAVIRGQVPDTQTAAAILQTVQTYFPQGVANMLTIDPSMLDSQRAGQIAQIINNPHITVQVNGPRVMLGGLTATAHEATRALNIARTFVESDDLVIDNIRVKPPMIEMDVVLAQVNWEDARHLGSNQLLQSLQVGYDGSLSFSDIYTKAYQNASQYGLQTITSGDTVLPSQPIFDNSRSDSQGRNQNLTHNQGLTLSAQTGLNALLESNCAKLISRPHVSVRSGEEAYIQVGGSFGVPVVTQNTTGVEYREYGTIVTIRPELIGEDEIDGYIKIEKSSEPIQKQFAAGNAVDQKRLESYSDFSCRIGETVVMSGMISTNEYDGSSKTPFLHRIPAVNLLFKAEGRSKLREELVVLITPVAARIEDMGHVPFSEEHDLWIGEINDERLNLKDQNLWRFMFTGLKDEWPCRDAECAISCPDPFMLCLPPDGRVDAPPATGWSAESGYYGSREGTDFVPRY